MPNYDEFSFNPPAPIAIVTLKNLENNIEISNVPMLIDTGADATLIPLAYAEKLNLDLSNSEFFELEGFDKSVSQSVVVKLQMIFEGRSFRGDFLTINQEYGIIGRNILNLLKMEFDGQNLFWKVL